MSFQTGAWERQVNDLSSHIETRSRTAACRIWVLAFLSLFFAVIRGQPALAQDPMMHREGSDHGGFRGGDHGGPGGLGGLGAGLGIGIINGIVDHQQEKDGGRNSSPKKPKDIAKKPLDNKPSNTPDIPAKSPPQPPTPVAGPPTPPTSDQPPTANPPPGSTVGPPAPPPDGNVPPTQTTSDTPPVTPSDQSTTPAGNYTPVAPRTPQYSESLECPQRYLGCEALIVDYSKAVWSVADMVTFDSTAASLRLAGCRVDYETPRLKDTPHATVIWRPVGDPEFAGGGAFEKVVVPPDAAAVREVKDFNQGQKEKLSRAIRRHRAILKLGVELAIEMINGHGSGDDPCGFVGLADSIAFDIDRAEFHGGNYQAIYDGGNHNACQWFVVDATCESGLTPEAVDIENNTAAQIPICKKEKPGPSCPLHAAYESDVAVGTTSATESCHQGTVFMRSWGLDRAVDSYLADKNPIPGQPHKRRVSRLNEYLKDAASSFASIYTDGGYKFCNPLTRDGYWEEKKTTACTDCKATSGAGPSPADSSRPIPHPAPGPPPVAPK